MTAPADPRASPPFGPAHHHYHKALETEKQLLTFVQSKGPFDPNVRILRNNIRELYESVILEDHEFAESHEVEQLLWRLHYTRIEEFRARIRKIMSSGGSGTGTAVVPSGNKPGVRREPVHKILAVFRSFLSEATGFYHDLILKIRAKHGLSQDDLSCDPLESADSKIDDKRTVELKRCQLSCHRCLIFLGDLARYKEYYADGDAANRDWSIAAGFYVKAASLWPSSGNPHNQLAVLATYVGDELLAVYHYYRSLAAETPFLTARDNLTLLFEKNRHNHSRLVASLAERRSHVTGQLGPGTTGAKKGKLQGEKALDSGHGNGKAIKRHPEQQDSGGAVELNVSETLKNFRVQFVRLNGILFTRTSLETFPEVNSCVLGGLEQLFGFKSEGFNTSFLSAGGIWASGPNVILQLVTILIFTVHNVNWNPDTYQPTYSEILQRSVILQNAFTATFECAGYLMQQCAGTDDTSTSPLLPGLLVVMEWLAGRPEMAIGTEVGEKEGHARVFFWRQCVNVLNRLLEEEVRDDEKGSLSGAFGSLSLKPSREESERAFLLWEDYELRGFTPLLPVQSDLDYSKRPTVGLGSKKERDARIRRLIKAGKAISITLEGNEKGIQYDSETDRFHVAGEKHRREPKQNVLGVPVEDSTMADALKENMDVRPFRDPNVKHLVLNPGKDKESKEFPLIKPSSGEEEDEVIVFKPLEKLKQQAKTNIMEQERNMAGISNAMSTTSSQIGPKNLTSSREELQKSSQEGASLFTGVDKLLPGPLPINVSSTTNHSSMISSDGGGAQGLAFESVAVACGVPEQASDHMSSKVVGSSIANSTFVSSNTSVSLGLVSTSSSSLATDFGGSSSGSMAGHICGPLNNWGSGNGFGVFPNQLPWSHMPANLNWQPQDAMVGNPPWNNESRMLATVKGLSDIRAGGQNIGLGERLSFSEVFPNVPQIVLPDNSQQNTYHGFQMPTMVSNLQAAPSFNVNAKLLDGLEQVKPSSQAANVAGKNDILSYGRIEEGVTSSAVRPVAGSLNDFEKAIPRAGVRPSGIRPPPGFGPFPGRPPVILPIASAFESKPVADGQLASTTVQSKPTPGTSQPFSDMKGASEGEEQQGDDYRWLDGYMPGGRDTSQLANLGQSSSVGSSDYGIWPAGSNPLAEVTASPFPGMKLSNRFSTTPLLPIAQQQQQQLLLQQQNLIAQLQLKRQPLLEQEHQHQERERQRLAQLQQFHTMQLEAQLEHERQHLQNLEQLQQPQESQASQQQPPQPVWYGQNYGRDSFVS